MVTNSNTILASAASNNHANVICIAHSAHSYMQVEPERSHQTSSQPDSTLACPEKLPTFTHNKNYSRGISSASEFSELSRFSGVSRESDTFSMDSLDSVGCRVTVVHVSPLAVNMPPPAHMMDMTEFPSHRHLPFAWCNSSGHLTNPNAITMGTNGNANYNTVTSESPMRLVCASQTTHTSISSYPSLDGIQPIRHSNTSNSTNNSPAEPSEASSRNLEQNVEHAQDNNNIQVSSPTAQIPFTTTKPPLGKWVTHAPSPNSSPVTPEGLNSPYLLQILIAELLFLWSQIVHLRDSMLMMS